MSWYVDFRENRARGPARFGGFVTCETQGEVDDYLVWFEAHGANTRVTERATTAAGHGARPTPPTSPPTGSRVTSSADDFSHVIQVLEEIGDGDR